MFILHLLNTALGGSSNENTQELQCDAKGDRRCEGEIPNIIIFTI